MSGWSFKMELAAERGNCDATVVNFTKGPPPPSCVVGSFAEVKGQVEDEFELGGYFTDPVELRCDK